MKKNQGFTHGYLCDEWDSRDSQDDLHNIEIGRHLEALSNLPGNLRQLLECGDLYVQLQEIDNRYQVTRIVKRREPEFSQGTDRYTAIDKFGNRLPITEDQYHALLGLEKDPEDVFNREDVEIVQLDHEQSAPKDIWDTTFNATDYVGTVQRLIDNEGWQSKVPLDLKKKQIDRLADELIFSGPWYPYWADKKIHHPRAKEIARRIQEESLTRRELARLIGRPLDDKRPAMAKRLQIKAKCTLPGKDKAKIAKKAQYVLASYIKDAAGRMKAEKNVIPSSDRNKLWSLWRDKEMKEKGSVELMHWQYEKALRAKLLRQGIDSAEVEKRVEKAVLKHYNRMPSGKPQMPSSKSRDTSVLDWLEKAVTEQSGASER